jgi:hypothetical protein
MSDVASRMRIRVVGDHPLLYPGSLDGVANVTRKWLGGNPECA